MTRQLETASSAGQRLAYLDWLRGVTVLVMILAHCLDSWVRPEVKTTVDYGRLLVLGGMAAPGFLFMAGIAAALAAGAHIRRGRSPVEAARRVERRGWQVFLYAFLFRLQSFVLGGFHDAIGLLKVDVLNVMGPAIALTAAVWRIGATRLRRGLVLGAAATLVGLATPAVREALAGIELPDPIEWYFRPDPGKGTFTLFPWAGFVMAGGVLGLAIDGGRGWVAWRLQGAILVAGAALGLLAWAASFQPPLFPTARFWTTSPAFFALRVGLLTCLVPLSWLWSVRPWPRLWRSSPMELMGLGSLFVYWVHVELVYGVFSRPLRQMLTLGQGLLAWILMSFVMLALLTGWNRLAPGRLWLREMAAGAIRSRI